MNGFNRSPSRSTMDPSEEMVVAICGSSWRTISRIAAADADDLMCRRHAELTADRVLARPVTPRHRFRDDRRHRRLLRELLLAGERASADEWNVERVEIAGRNHAP